MYIKNPEYFITTVREGSISKAAEKLYGTEWNCTGQSAW